MVLLQDKWEKEQKEKEEKELDMASSGKQDVTKCAQDTVFLYISFYIIWTVSLSHSKIYLFFLKVS